MTNLKEYQREGERQLGEWDLAMGQLEQEWGMEPSDTQYSGYEGLVADIERIKLSKKQFEVHKNAMELMLEKRRSGEQETIIGPVMATGIGGNMMALVLYPAGEGKYVDAQIPNEYTNIEGSELLDGTPVLVMVNDLEVSKKLEGANHAERVQLWNQAFERAAERIRSGEERLFVDGGGWGNIPLAMKARGDLALQFAAKDMARVGMVLLPGLFGSMDTMHEGLMRNQEITKILRLGHFAAQIEQFFRDTAQMLIPGIASSEQIAEFYKNVNNIATFHSMGGYLFLSWLLRPQLFELARVMQEGGKTKFVADKSLMVGSSIEKDDMYEWMWTVVDSLTYRNQVGLHSSWRGELVKWGAESFWGKYSWLERAREFVIANNILPISLLIRYFLPSGPLDARNNRFVHQMSYATYREFTQLSNFLLEMARPVASQDTMRLAQKNVNLIRSLWLILGGGDNVLRHDIAQVLAKWLRVPTKHIIGNLSNGETHQISLQEFLRVLGLYPGERKEYLQAERDVELVN